MHGVLNLYLYQSTFVVKESRKGGQLVGGNVDRLLVTKSKVISDKGG